MLSLTGAGFANQFYTTVTEAAGNILQATRWTKRATFRDRLLGLVERHEHPARLRSEDGWFRVQIVDFFQLVRLDFEVFGQTQQSTDVLIDFKRSRTLLCGNTEIISDGSKFS